MPGQNEDPAAAPLQLMRDVWQANTEWARANGREPFFGSADAETSKRKYARTVWPSPHGAYFISSEPGPFLVRVYTLWLCRETGEIIPISDPGEYGTLQRARKVAQSNANVDWHARRKMNEVLAVRAAREAAEDSPEGIIRRALSALDAHVGQVRLPSEQAYGAPQDGRRPQPDFLPSPESIRVASVLASEDQERRDRALITRAETRGTLWEPGMGDNFAPDNGAGVAEWGECNSGEGAIYSPEYLMSKLGRDTA